MDIEFSNAKLRKLCNSDKEMRKSFGSQIVDVLKARLDDLRAAATLEDMRHSPGRCHELSGDRRGQLALDLRGQNRLLFVPSHTPLPKNTGGGLDWKKVTVVKIIEVNIDYH